MYLTEISPVHLRGAVGTIYQLIIALSILISQILGLPEIFGTEHGWPILFGKFYCSVDTSELGKFKLFVRK